MISHAQKQGERDAQEDKYVILKQEKRLILAVMDGHRGDETAALCSDTLPSLFVDTSRSARESIQEAFEILDSKTNEKIPGTTLSIVIIEKGIVTVGTLGDSPVVVTNSSGIFFRSREHNTSNKKEVAAVKARGAIFTGKGKHFVSPSNPKIGLATTRALGDQDFTMCLSRIPDIYVVKKPEVILVCTDGFLSSDMKYRYALLKEYLPIKMFTAESLMQWAESSPEGLFDNTTILYWRKEWLREI